MDDDDVRFRFKLASHLGVVNPFWLDFLLTDSELRAWADYLRLEPVMSDRIEAQLAVISAMAYSYLTQKPMDCEAFKISSTVSKKVDKKAEFEKRLRDVFKI